MYKCLYTKTAGALTMPTATAAGTTAIPRTLIELIEVNEDNINDYLARPPTNEGRVNPRLELLSRVTSRFLTHWGKGFPQTLPFSLALPFPLAQGHFSLRCIFAGTGLFPL